MTSNLTAGTRLLGALGEDDGRGVVRIEDRYDTDIDDLWTALTDPDRLARWYGRVEGDLRLGGRFTTRIDPVDIDATGQIEACEPPQCLLVRTRETDESAARGQGPAPFDQTVEATLRADGDQTNLVLEIRGLPLDKVAAYGAGWQIHAETRRPPRRRGAGRRLRPVARDHARLRGAGRRSALSTGAGRFAKQRAREGGPNQPCGRQAGSTSI